jgi:protein subunit release factor A|tara:strand:+ start:725 stop:1096 length:372 start_codon:yes stop_codon:yes gene_type:complete
MSEEKTFFVGIEDPSNKRRDILECSKGVVRILKTYDSINDIRKEKIEKIAELKKIMTEIKRLNNILKEHLPTEKIRSSPSPTKKIKKSSPKKEAKITKKPDKNIKKLESELSEIESKLSSMDV